MNHRRLAVGGIVGPAAFIAAWSVLGSLRDGYAPVDDAISELAATGTSTQTAMTLGFLSFGAGLGLFGVALRSTSLRAASWPAIANAAATVGVAAFPLGPGADHAHAAMAIAGYASVVAIPLAASRGLARTGQTRWALASRVVAGVSAACLVATLGPHHGLWQRAGLTIADAWIVVTAAAIASGRLVGDAEG